MHSKRPLHSQRGIGKLTLIVFASIIGALVFAGYQIIPFYYYFYELRNQMEALIRVAGIETDQSIRKKLEYHMKKMDIPADITEVKMQRDGNKMQIVLDYKEVFYIKYRGKTYDLYVFPFRAEAAGSF